MMMESHWKQFVNKSWLLESEPKCGYKFHSAMLCCSRSIAVHWAAGSSQLQPWTSKVTKAVTNLGTAPPVLQLRMKQAAGILELSFPANITFYLHHEVLIPHWVEETLSQWISCQFESYSRVKSTLFVIWQKNNSYAYNEWEQSYYHKLCQTWNGKMETVSCLWMKN